MKRSYLLAALLACAPLSSMAADGEPDYTYLEGGYTHFDANRNEMDDFDGDGGYLRGALDLSRGVYLLGSYHRVKDDDEDFANIDFSHELSLAEVGAGYHMPMGEGLDFIGELTYVNVHQKFSARAGGVKENESIDDDGARLSLGVRGGNHRVEGWFKAGYLDVGDMGSGWVGTLGGQVRFNPMWSLVAEVEAVEWITRYNVGARISF